MLKLKGFWIVVVGLVFAVIQTALFGWNLLAASNFELICDGIVVIVCFIGARIFWAENLKAV